jgi:hypothetical protein
MRKTLIVVVMSGLLIGLWLWWPRENRSSDLRSFAEKATLNTDHEPSPANDIREPHRQNEQIAVESLSQAEIGAEVTRRERSDPKWEWKYRSSFMAKL